MIKIKKKLTNGLEITTSVNKIVLDKENNNYDGKNKKLVSEHNVQFISTDD